MASAKDGPGQSESTRDFIQVVRLAMAGGAPGAQTLLRRLARKYSQTDEDLSQAIMDILRDSPLRSASVTAVATPVDTDSRLSLVREEFPVILVNDPILPAEVQSALDQVVAEHRASDQLKKVGLVPTRTALFVGPPGVGKTLAARWIARELNQPLIVLDLASVMSSYLGRTGVNVRRVLDYARGTAAVLFLDELDAVAKRRDDSTEIGELKRLVTVLLQEIDTWPDDSLLLAATNHEDLLDPAVWRRFEAVVRFPLPDVAAIEVGIREFFDGEHVAPEMVDVLARLYLGSSLSEVERDILRARRINAISGGDPVDSLARVVKQRLRSLAPSERGPLAAKAMSSSKLTQRQFHELTGVSRDTLRKYANDSKKGTEDA